MFDFNDLDMLLAEVFLWHLVVGKASMVYMAPLTWRLIVLNE